MSVGLPVYTPDLLGMDGWRRATRRWEKEGLVEKLWASDPSVWGKAAPRAGEWLGWLDLPGTMGARLGEMTRMAEEAASEGIADVVLLGMGGSSLAPEMFFSVFGSAPGRPRLTVLDSTHPEAVASVRTRIDPARTLFLVSSKSGTTVETLSFYRYFWEQCSGEGARFAAVTDRGTPLDRLGRERGFRAVFNAPADVGGRFSAFSAFGLVPAALIGVNLPALLERAREMADRGRNRAAENPGVGLGLVLGAAAATGMDKLTLHTTESLGAFPAWMEQLVAESLGKNGVGIVPVAGEPVLPSGLYGDDRIFLVWESADEPPADLPSGLSGARIEVEDPLDLGPRFSVRNWRWRRRVKCWESIPLISLMWRRPNVWRRRRWAGGARSPGQIWRRLSQPRPRCLSAGWWRSWDPVTTWGFRPICLPARGSRRRSMRSGGGSPGQAGRPPLLATVPGFFTPPDRSTREVRRTGCSCR